MFYEVLERLEDKNNNDLNKKINDDNEKENYSHHKFETFASSLTGNDEMNEIYNKRYELEFKIS